MIGNKIIKLDQVASTNTYAMDLLKEQEVPDGTIIWTENQTQGRGQRGNSWESETGMNLTFSTILFPHFLKVEEQFMLSKVASLAISDLLVKHIDAPKIKWPNDIYVKNDKIAGILIESSIINFRFDYVIVGIGLNINQLDFSDDIPNPTSIKRITNQVYSLEDMLSDLSERLDYRYNQLITYDVDELNSDYLSQLYRYNEYFNYQEGSNIFTARITGLDPFGALMLETKEGEMLTYGFNEVDYIL